MKKIILCLFVAVGLIVGGIRIQASPIDAIGNQFAIQTVRNGTYNSDQTLTIGKAFDSFPLFENVKWDAINDPSGRLIVIAKCKLKDIIPTPVNGLDYYIIFPFVINENRKSFSQDHLQLEAIGDINISSLYNDGKVDQSNEILNKLKVSLDVSIPFYYNINITNNTEDWKSYLKMGMNSLSEAIANNEDFKKSNKQYRSEKIKAFMDEWLNGKDTEIGVPLVYNVQVGSFNGFHFSVPDGAEIPPGFPERQPEGGIQNKKGTIIFINGSPIALVFIKEDNSGVDYVIMEDKFDNFFLVNQRPWGNQIKDSKLINWYVPKFKEWALKIKNTPKESIPQTVIKEIPNSMSHDTNATVYYLRDKELGSFVQRGTSDEQITESFAQEVTTLKNESVRIGGLYNVYNVKLADDYPRILDKCLELRLKLIKEETEKVNQKSENINKIKSDADKLNLN